MNWNENDYRFVVVRSEIISDCLIYFQLTLLVLEAGTPVSWMYSASLSVGVFVMLCFFL